MINKENVLFCLVGLFAGAIIGFMFANSVNQSAALTAINPAAVSANMPAGHPPTGTQGGSIPEVQAAIEKARAEPNNFEAQIKAAEMYYQIQRFEGAVEFLKQAAKLKPDDLDTIINLGNAYFDSGKYEDAEKSYTAALAKKPDDLNVRTDLGLTFVFRPQPDYDRAIKEFNTALEKEPNHVQALQNLTIAFTKKGDSAKATAALQRLEAVEPSNTAIAKLKEEIDKIVVK
ncbi:MAG TPA: tetratricopeptide repeat protein [Pyrinomonadaceae bacterium]|nr:tetratricopeptide repeat protein [Chloracidobacterium sp.]HBE82814.1 hypothetical protein [Blastocatellia bacterium]HRJ88240.1 tetratricopeptide repeat protein [Pyrinomonadaceae bacterium]HRK49306.1 tetratricopeptide repeat protein [Pyrinomonadaceae bacterium]